MLFSLPFGAVICGVAIRFGTVAAHLDKTRNLLSLRSSHHVGGRLGMQPVEGHILARVFADNAHQVNYGFAAVQRPPAEFPVE
jgi:hypothetical protein